MERRYGHETINSGVCAMKDVLILIGIIAVWVVLQKYILPRLGVPT